MKKEPTAANMAFRYVAVALFILVIINAFARVIIFTPVHGTSMEPTYHPKQMLVTYTKTNPTNYEYGDIIVFRPSVPTESGPIVNYLIKRCVGVPGDVLEYDETSHRLVRNGTPLDETYIAKDAYENGFEWELGKVVVPEDCLFLMGDNRNDSFDSRRIGPVPYTDVVGKVIGT